MKSGCRRPIGAAHEVMRHGGTPLHTPADLPPMSAVPLPPHPSIAAAPPGPMRVEEMPAVAAAVMNARNDAATSANLHNMQAHIQGLNRQTAVELGHGREVVELRRHIGALESQAHMKEGHIARLEDKIHHLQREEPQVGALFFYFNPFSWLVCTVSDAINCKI